MNVKANTNINIIEGLFLDLDGVILKNSVNVYLKYVTDYINEFTPVPLSYVKNYYRTVNSFPLAEALYLVFKSLGLEDKINPLFSKINTLENYKTEKIIINKGFTRLVDFCNRNKIQYKILTMASLKKTQSFLSDFKIGNICCLKQKSKADLKTYLFLKKNLGIVLENWLFVDDDPLALKLASVSGLKTALMKSKLFNKSYCKDFIGSIDIVVDSFDQIIEFVKNTNSYL